MTSDTREPAAPTLQPRNTPARVSFWSAASGIGLIVAVVVTPMFWLPYGSHYTFALLMLGAVAVPAGHLGRRRGKRPDARDRGLALFGIVTGWLLILVSLLVFVVFTGTLAALGLLFGTLD
ncbi:DUF4190 domain-containing protein [Streptomyces sp. NPDC059134]|uniref:DUF4190 domain-containing protein n=1 Tax=Streptomyces sp. NPDC059134 TaxID=3346738 RepID=UPI0036A36B39